MLNVCKPFFNITPMKLIELKGEPKRKSKDGAGVRERACTIANEFVV